MKKFHNPWTVNDHAVTKPSLMCKRGNKHDYITNYTSQYNFVVK